MYNKSMNQTEIELIDSKIETLKTDMMGQFALISQKMDTSYKKKQNVRSNRNLGLKAVLYGVLGSFPLIL